MKISIQAGHGLTPPGELCYPRRAKLDHWHYQRGVLDLTGLECGHFGVSEGRRWVEDEFNMHMAELVARKVLARGHSIYSLRALDHRTGERDRSIVKSIPDDLHPDLQPSQWLAVERWRYCASVEAILRTMEEKTKAPPRRGARWRGWSWDPEAAIWFERQQRSDIYISFHVNAYTKPDVHGLEFFHYRKSQKGKAAAGLLKKAFLNRFKGHRLDTGRPYKVHSSGLYEVRKSGPPAVLIECGYQTNDGDLRVLTDADEADKLAEALADGIDAIA